MAKSLWLGAAASVLLLSVPRAAHQQQDGFAGSWETPVGWSFFLKMDAGRPQVGMVSHCATPLVRPVEIHDVAISGNTIRFACTSPDRTRSISFVGQLDGTALRLTWQRTVRSGAENNTLDRIFGAAATGQLNAVRAPDGELAELASETRGFQYAGAVNLVDKNTKIEGLLFIPRAATRVRTLIVTIRYGLGQGLHEASAWRKLAENVSGGLLGIRYTSIGPTPGGLTAVNQSDGGADALIELLNRLAKETGHPEISTAPWILWGHSAAGAVASSLAALHPNRTLAVVRHNSGPATADVNVLTRIPFLFVAGGKDGTAPGEAAESLWKTGRAVLAPWTFALVPDAAHNDLEEAADFTLLWMDSVVKHRLRIGMSGLQAVSAKAAWLGARRAGRIASSETFSGPATDASWLPNELVARSWLDLQRMKKK